jgi:hypothetical protein
MSPLYHRKLPNPTGAVLLRLHRLHVPTPKAEEARLKAFQQASLGPFLPTSR